MSTQLITTGNIVEARISKVEETINKLNKKLTKRNLPNITFKTGDAFEVTHQHFDTAVTLNHVPIELKGTFPAIEGKRILGTCVYDEDDLPTYFGDVPEEYRGIKNAICQHCNTKRTRKMYAVIEDTETKDKILVGRSCLKEYIGIDGDAILSLAKWFSVITQEVMDDQDVGYYCKSKLSGFSPKKYLAVVCSLCRDSTFISKTKAEEQGYIPTWVLAMNNYSRVELCENDWIEAEQIIKYFNDLGPNEGNYIANVKNRLVAEWLSESNLAFVASAYSSWKRALEKALKEEMHQSTAASEYFGTLKERLTISATLIRKGFYDTKWNSVTVYTFLTEDGNVCVWKASSALTGKYNVTEIDTEDNEEYTYEERYRAEIGDKVEIIGTVSEHEVYGHGSDATKTTYINRVVLNSFERDGISTEITGK